ncbi:MAG: glycoside hydrolase family 3 [Lachnospiraceae bacterium]|nr:glycoside hydrolase family 3 [Lachnospiraceae bacterium]
MKHRKVTAKKRILIGIIIALCVCIAGMIAGFTIYRSVHGRRSAPATEDQAAHKKEDPAHKKSDVGKEEQAEPADPVRDRAEEILKGMSLQEKVDQMFLITPEKLTGVSVVVQAGESTKAALQEYPVGGLVYFSQNLESAEQTASMIQSVQEYSRIPLLIAVDEEGGDVARVAGSLGTTRFEPMYRYRAQGGETARQNARTIGQDISRFGFNTDFAPVADVWSNHNNTVIGERAYSDDFTEAAMLVPEAVRGFHDAGIICCLKHFPGHGETNEDSHSQAAFTDKSPDEMAAQEWTVFKAGIDAEADMVMIGHVTATQIDDVPATVSSKLVNDILRRQLGFAGVVITDSLQMGAVTQKYKSGDLAVKAVQAGVDMLLEPADFAQAEQSLTEAVQNGTVSEERIDESVQRILEMKIRRGIVQ